MGKIVLQRLELRSPLTVPGQNKRPLDSQSQIDPSEHARAQSATGAYPNNRYNNRGILKTNTLQPQPQRVYTRSSSERPSNGYDTDTGIVNYNYRTGYRNGSHANIVNNNNYAMDVADSDAESLPQFRISSPQSVHHGSRYEVNGYDTDSGLMNRSVNGRRSLEPRLMSRNVDNSSGAYSQPMQINRISASNSNLNENGSRVQSVQRSSVDSARRIPVQLVTSHDDINENEKSERSAFQSIKQNDYAKSLNGVNGSQVIRTSLSNIPNGLSAENRATPSRISNGQVESTVIR